MKSFLPLVTASILVGLSSVSGHAQVVAPPIDLPPGIPKPIPVRPRLDYGDAPNTYGTTLAANGARHVATTALRLGNRTDIELDGAPSVGADGDDAAGVPDDEDGVIVPVFRPGVLANVSVRVTAPCRLNAWVDWNRNGSFDPGEAIAINRPMAAGVNLVPVLAPAAAAPGVTYSRFRINSAGGLGPTGPATDGEVEDYRGYIMQR
jgi:hypothetical protein